MLFQAIQHFRYAEEQIPEHRKASIYKALESDGNPQYMHGALSLSERDGSKANIEKLRYPELSMREADANVDGFSHHTLIHDILLSLRMPQIVNG